MFTPLEIVTNAVHSVSGSPPFRHGRIKFRGLLVIIQLVLIHVTGSG